MTELPDSSGTDQDRDAGEIDTRTAFPTNAVVGIVSDPAQLPELVRKLRSDGHSPEVLCGERGLDRLESAAGLSREEVHVIRSLQQLFGFEADHAERHQAALEAGDFLVVVGARDDADADQAGSVLGSHGGRFVNHYTRWTGRTLIP